MQQLYRLLTFVLTLVIVPTIMVAEDRSVTVSKKSPSTSTTFSGTKTSDRGYIRNLIVGTADQGTILMAKILADPEGEAWKQNSSGLPNYQVRFTGTQKAGAADTKTKQYVPQFQGKAVVKGSGSGTRDEYEWNATAVYNISDHDMISDQYEENDEAKGTKITVTHNEKTEKTQWKNYTYTPHGFNVTGNPDDIVIVNVPDYIQMPGMPGDKHAKCDSSVSPNYPAKAVTPGYTKCTICDANNKYKYAFRFAGSIDITSKITMPIWTNIAIAGPKSKKLWNNWWTSLYTHEKGHWDIDVACAEKFKTWADNKNAALYVVEVCCGSDRNRAKQEAIQKANQWAKELKQQMDLDKDQFISEWKSKHNEYDTTTSHGETQGVSFGGLMISVSE